MSEKTLTSEQVLTILAQTPPRIAALTNHLELTQLHTPPKSGEWSANDILAHLRACADVWGGCIMKTISEDRPTFKAVSPRSWINKTDYPKQEFPSSFHAFTTQRADLLAVLESLPHEGWSRAAMVSTVGKIYERTVLHYGERMARHERGHIRQIERLISQA
jgi:hypothetical protein